MYPPQPEPVADRETRKISRPWLAFFQSIIDAVTTLQSQILVALGWGVWLPYSPTWTSTGTQPAIVDGQFGGSYAVVNGVCHYQIQLISGAGTTFGTGVYFFSLPVVSTATPPGSTTVAGTSLLLSAGAYYVGGVRQFNTSLVTMAFGQGVAQCGPGTPIALVAPVQWGISGTYRL